MDRDIKKEATELVTHGPQTALRISESTPIEVSRQAGSPKNYTNSYLDSNFWPAGEPHPYYQVSENLEYAVGTLEEATNKRSKRTCIRSLEAARVYVKRGAIILLPLGRDTEVRASLTTVLTILPHSVDHERELSLQELKMAADQAIQILEGTQQKIAQLIVADEDARYPGCRNDEGELIVGGLCK